MAFSISSEFQKEDQTKILWVKICDKDFEVIDISINE